jgi:DNA-binding transcriptional LysR family regulator
MAEGLEAARWTFTEGGRRVAVRVRPAVVSNDMDLLRHAALAGVGFAMLPRFLLAGDLASGALVPVEGDWTVQRGEVHAVYAAPSLPATRALIGFLREHVPRLPGWSAGE